jgi:hypothetical protein
MVRFQYYNGDIKKSKPLGFINLETFIEKHVEPSDNLLGVFKQIEEATKNGDKALKSKLKMENLYSFTVSAQFKGTRKYDDIVDFNPIAQLDFDGLTEQEAEEFRDWIFEQYPQIICSYLSPSRKGVKALIRIPKISLENGIANGINEYKDYYRAIESEFGNYKGFDAAPKNLVLPLFISYDFFMPSRTLENAEIWDLKEFEPDSLTQKFPLPVKPYKKLKSNDKNEQRAYNTVRKAISNIVSSPGHYQLRSACLIFGTRCGAGYVDINDAKREVEQLVRQNAYLSKGVNGYITTALWGLEQGYRTPNYY